MEVLQNDRLTDKLCVVHLLVCIYSVENSVDPDQKPSSLDICCFPTRIFLGLAL